MSYFGKSYRTGLSRKPTEVSQNMLTFILIGHPLQNNSSFKKMITQCFLAAFKMAYILNFQLIKYLGKGFSNLEN